MSSRSSISISRLLLVLVLIDRGGNAFSGYALGQLPAFLGIVLVPGLLAMLLYYLALSHTPASLATVAELGYPLALFLIFSLPAPVGQGAPLRPIEVVGAAILVASRMDTAGDLFGRPHGSPQTDALIATAVQWAERIMRKIDNVLS